MRPTFLNSRTNRYSTHSALSEAGSEVISAICGYDARLGNTDLGLDAAHIKWHAAGGPDTPNNGMALCSFHHLAFDRGALSLNEDLRILVSKDVHGQNHIDQLLLRYSGKPLKDAPGRRAFS